MHFLVGTGIFRV